MTGGLLAALIDLKRRKFTHADPIAESMIELSVAENHSIEASKLARSRARELT
jgi:hypothetical protein